MKILKYLLALALVTTTASAQVGPGPVVPTNNYVSSSLPAGSAVSVPATTNTINITSISLAAGTWQICANAGSSVGAATIVTAYQVAISVVSATNPTPPNGGAYTQLGFTFPTGQNEIFPVGCLQLTLATAGTVFLTGRADFTGGTVNLYGSIGAKKVP